MQLQQDFLWNQGRKGFKFLGDTDDLPCVTQRYAEKMKHATSDEEHFNILYMLLEGEPDKTYNGQLVIENKTEAQKKGVA